MENCLVNNDGKVRLESFSMLWPSPIVVAEKV